MRSSGCRQLLVRRVRDISVRCSVVGRRVAGQTTSKMRQVLSDSFRRDLITFFSPFTSIPLPYTAAFITCRLDYCNSLLYGVSNNLMQTIQSVQNAAARLVTGTRRCEHTTPVLQKRHWLPIRRRMEFKLACLVHQSLAGQTLTYLTTDIQLTADTGRPQLRSASETMCRSTHTQQLR